MKKLAMTSLLVIAFTAVSIAQQAPLHNGAKKQMMQLHHQDNFTPEQRANLKAKHLTLAFELTDKQQEELIKLFSEEEKMMQEHHQKMSAQKEANKEVNRYSLMNQHMDLKIDHQRKIKDILTEDQYLKWSRMKQGNRKALKGGIHHGKDKGHQCDGTCNLHEKEMKNNKPRKHQLGAMHQQQALRRR